MNQQDLNTLTDAWHSDTGWLNDKIDEYFKSAQDHAYQLGLARGRLEAAQHHAPAPAPLTDERALFEAHQSRNGWAESDLNDKCATGHQAGEYRDPRLQDDWELWQARAELSQVKDGKP